MKMDEMPGMDMGHAGHDMGAAPKSAAMLPEGQALRELPLLANEADTPRLFRANLTAEPAMVRFAEALDTPILGYNGMSPGPLIEVTEGDRVEIAFTNRIPEETSTIHLAWNAGSG
ncbi:multicopper oxidase domain-containing protein [Mesorhizobium sp. M0118]